METFTFFVPIKKVEKAEDGSRIVHGYASTETLDLDGEIVSKDAVEKALPAYMEWRNIRQMHQPIAVGVAKEANVDDKGLYLTSKIVAPDCIKLIDEEVLKGYSIGGRKLSKKGNTITEIELIEISVVDRPSNPDCRIEIAKAVKSVKPTTFTELPSEGEDFPDFLKPGFAPKTIEESRGVIKMLASMLGKGFMPFGKREFSEKERDAAAESGAALPDGSFPIHNKSDLENAISAFGRAKNKARAKRHIIRRARALGATDMLPADWPGSTKEKKEKLAKYANFHAVARLAQLLADLEWAEELLESEGGMFGGMGETNINISKETCNRFGAMLVEMGDIVAEVLDELLVAMNEEEHAEALEEAATLSKDNERLATLVKVLGGPAPDAISGSDREHDEDGGNADVFAQLKEIAMTGSNAELAKRHSAAHKAALAKAAYHINKAVGLHKVGMGHLHKAAAACVKKAAAEVDHSAVAGHIGNAHQAFSEMADHHEMALHHLGKAAGETEGQHHDEPEVGGEMTSPGQHTEGHVPIDTAGEAYPGKFAKILEDLTAKLVEQAEAIGLAKGEAKGSEKLIEALSRMPAAGKARVFSVEKTPFAGATEGEGSDKDTLSALLEGVSVIDANDPDQRNAAVGKMLGNMYAKTFAGDRRFAKSILDPNFRGQAASGRPTH